ncbi:MAG: selenite/tellurite reduction operon c-type cytochrome lipoprotein ExtS [Desulfuromonas sp.]|nr:selenite/tellurite reduction operon c-type cytochrome lipoprotein ExtS [Desulfuromonas sp.]
MVAWLVFLALALCPVVSSWASGSEISDENTAINSCIGCHSERLSVYVCNPAQVQEAQLRCVWCHRGNAATSRVDLAHNNLIGKEYAGYRLRESEVFNTGVTWIERLACRRCHVLNKQGNLLTTNLDQLLSRASIGEIESALAVPAFYMPIFALNDGVRQAVITQILAGGVEYAASQEDPPRVVHFADKLDHDSLFEKHCGACHIVLTGRKGGLGVGVQGPNLSGLLSKFYPANALNNQLWTAAGLSDWIKNPRKIRPLTTMPPLVLDDQVIKQLIEDTWSK